MPPPPTPMPHLYPTPPPPSPISTDHHHHHHHHHRLSFHANHRRATIISLPHHSPSPFLPPITNHPPSSTYNHHKPLVWVFGEN
ncbi:hypothetical protein HanPSC8_Chr02g0079401 [Helianthus annuus]|nr:hypothetical protein HanPSC8_Chr02g0079401 [Helianthus annuus]